MRLRRFQQESSSAFRVPNTCADTSLVNRGSFPENRDTSCLMSSGPQSNSRRPPPDDPDSFPGPSCNSARPSWDFARVDNFERETLHSFDENASMPGTSSASPWFQGTHGDNGANSMAVPGERFNFRPNITHREISQAVSDCS